MITITDKLYVTKEINIIMLQYANQNVLRPLLYKFSFKKGENEITDLLEILNSWNGDNATLEVPEIGIRVKKLINSFLISLSDVDMYALYYWIININYEKYSNEIAAEVEEVKETMVEYESRIGRKIAEKIYYAEEFGLRNDLEEELLSYLIMFASEFDFSLVDDQSIEFIKETIEGYKFPRWI